MNNGSLTATNFMEGCIANNSSDELSQTSVRVQRTGKLIRPLCVCEASRLEVILSHTKLFFKRSTRARWCELQLSDKAQSPGVTNNETAPLTRPRVSCSDVGGSILVCDSKTGTLSALLSRRTGLFESSTRTSATTYNSETPADDTQTVENTIFFLFL